MKLYHNTSDEKGVCLNIYFKLMVANFCCVKFIKVYFALIGRYKSGSEWKLSMLYCTYGSTETFDYAGGNQKNNQL